MTDLSRKFHPSVDNTGTRFKYSQLGLNYDRLVSASKKQFDSKNIDDWIPSYDGYKNTILKNTPEREKHKEIDDLMNATYVEIMNKDAYRRFARG